MTVEIGTFWVGSNGNLFCDSAKHRYCIAKDDTGYRVSRDGNKVEHAETIGDARGLVRLFVQAD